MMDKIISAKNVELKFGKGSEEVVALKNISLEVGAGEFVSFIGPSGCGKTTFLRTVAALEKPTSGQVLVNGVSPDEARIIEHMAMSFNQQVFIHGGTYLKM